MTGATEEALADLSVALVELKGQVNKANPEKYRLFAKQYVLKIKELVGQLEAEIGQEDRSNG